MDLDAIVAGATAGLPPARRGIQRLSLTQSVARAKAEGAYIFRLCASDKAADFEFKEALRPGVHAYNTQQRFIHFDGGGSMRFFPIDVEPALLRGLSGEFHKD